MNKGRIIKHKRFSEKEFLDYHTTLTFSETARALSPFVVATKLAEVKITAQPLVLSITIPEHVNNLLSSGYNNKHQTLRGNQLTCWASTRKTSTTSTFYQHPTLTSTFTNKQL